MQNLSLTYGRLQMSSLKAAILLCFHPQVVPVGTNAAQNLERLTFPFTKKEDPVILIQERDLLSG